MKAQLEWESYSVDSVQWKPCWQVNEKGALVKNPTDYQMLITLMLASSYFAAIRRTNKKDICCRSICLIICALINLFLIGFSLFNPREMGVPRGLSGSSLRCLVIDANRCPTIGRKWHKRTDKHRQAPDGAYKQHPSRTEIIWRRTRLPAC